MGVRVVADRDTTQVDEHTLLGGSPRRVLRLSALGHAAWADLRGGAVRSPAAAVLARRLTDAGLAHPRPGPAAGVLDVTVVIPVRDRPLLLDRCLNSLGARFPVVVVDDGSSNPAAVETVARRHGATLVTRPVSGGAAAARNTGLVQIDSEFVAFLDSDCSPPPDWIPQLSGHFADPLVAAVAPRIIAAQEDRRRYLSACGRLDLGPREGRVRPNTRVAYVPTAALIVRRSALFAVARNGEVFDPALRYGEDVDLVWRLDAAGWRVRYDPAVTVGHEESASWRDRLGRRFRYGTSAAPLAQRHPTALSPVVLRPWPMLAVIGLLGRRPLVAGAGIVASTVTTRRGIRRADLDLQTARATAASVAVSWLGVGRYATQFAAPVVAFAAVTRGSDRPSRRRSRRAAAVSLLLAPPLAAWLGQRPSVGPVRFVAGRVADDMAYGAGVYAGCLASRTLIPLRPEVSR
jgi:mycofactocin system glycosyltransferase